nr:stefin 3 [Enteromyxum leei]
MLRFYFFVSAFVAVAFTHGFPKMKTKPLLLGGWSNRSVDQYSKSVLKSVFPEVLEKISFDESGSRSYPLFEILEHQTQVVAGTNHRLIVKFENSPITYYVFVFEGLPLSGKQADFELDKLGFHNGQEIEILYERNHRVDHD